MPDDDGEDLLDGDPHGHAEKGGPVFPENWEANWGFIQFSFYLGSGWLRFGPGGWGLHFLRDDHRPLFSERNGHKKYRVLGPKGTPLSHWRVAPIERLETYVVSKTHPSIVSMLTEAYWRNRTRGEQYLAQRSYPLAMTRFTRASESASFLLAVTRDPAWRALGVEADRRQQTAMVQLAMNKPTRPEPPDEPSVNVFKAN